MNIYSLHSHKGGVGKTTFGLFFGKYLAQVRKEKTCLIDLDFQAQGLRDCYFRDEIKFDFADYLLVDEKGKKGIVEKIPIQSRDFHHLTFIASHFKPQLDGQERMEILKKMYVKLANEIYTGEITDNLRDILKYLEKDGYKNIIIDDHPGLVLLSEQIIKQIKSTPVFVTTPNIVSFAGLFKNILERKDDWKLKLPEIKIILNRAPAYFSLENLPGILEEFQKSPDAGISEKLVCGEIRKNLLSGKNGLAVIKESDEIKNMDTVVNPKTLLSLDVPEDLRRAAKMIVA